MPRPGTSSGGHRSSGGHSSSRVGGGHHVGRSSRPTGSSSFNRGSSMHHYHHTPPPPRRGYYGYRRNVYTSSSSGLGTLIACLIVFAVVIFSFFMIASDDSDVTSTINREKIENPIPYDNNCIKDELGYVENTSKLSKNLKNFYNKTGIQPYIYLKSYDETLTSDSQKDNYAQNWYEQNIDNEDTFLFVYYEDQDPNEIGYMAYVNGKQVTSVMDSEAVNIFWNYIDRYWTDDSLSTVEVFTKTFNSTANTIMEKSTTSNDIIKIICIIVGIIIVIGGIIYILRMKFKRDKEKAKETVEILKGIVENIKPKLLIVIDALASRSIDRISSTIQISDTGIVPGAGVGNTRQEISEKTLGIPIISIGIPTVVELATLVSDGIDIFIDRLQEKAESNEYLNKLQQDDKYEEVKEALNVGEYNMIVTPKEIDDLIENMKDIVARGINFAI